MTTFCKSQNQERENILMQQAPATETINLMSFGAKGLGVASLKEDTAALHKAIAYLNAKGGGKLYIPNPPEFYAFAGDGIFVGNNIEIYGDGKDKSEIRNVDPISGHFLHGTIFLFSTYGAGDNTNIFQDGIDQYEIQDAKLNDQQVILKNPANASKLNKGEIVVLGSGRFNHGTKDKKSRFHNMELNEISGISNGVIKFTYPFSVNLDSKDGAAPVIVNINNTQSQNKSLKIRNATSKNIYIHDMSFTQAQTNEVTNQPISREDMKNSLTGVWQPGGAFNSKFENLYISAYNTIGGNMFTRCEFSNLELHAKKKLVDFGYGASNNSVHDVVWKFLPSPASDFASSFIIINDGTHNIEMYNIKADGDWAGENIILLSQAKNINIHDVDINFPHYVNSSVGISIGDNEGYASENITIKNFTLNVSKIGLFTTIYGENQFSDINRNIVFDNVTYCGIVTGNRVSVDGLVGGNARKHAKKAGKKANESILGAGFAVRNISGLQLNNMSVASGDFIFMNTNNATLDHVIAANSNLISKNSNLTTSNNQFLNSASDIRGGGNRRNRNEEKRENKQRQ